MKNKDDFTKYYTAGKPTKYDQEQHIGIAARFQKHLGSLSSEITGSDYSIRFNIHSNQYLII